MDAPRDAEAWADALLERNRTAPPGTSFEEEPVIQYMRDRSAHYAKAHRRFASLEAAALLVGTVLLCAFGYAFYSGV